MYINCKIIFAEKDRNENISYPYSHTVCFVIGSRISKEMLKMMTGDLRARFQKAALLGDRHREIFFHFLPKTKRRVSSPYKFSFQFTRCKNSRKQIL